MKFHLQIKSNREFALKSKIKVKETHRHCNAMISDVRVCESWPDHQHRYHLHRDSHEHRLQFVAIVDPVRAKHCTFYGRILWNKRTNQNNFSIDFFWLYFVLSSFCRREKNLLLSLSVKSRRSDRNISFVELDIEQMLALKRCSLWRNTSVNVHCTLMPWQRLNIFDIAVYIQT